MGSIESHANKLFMRLNTNLTNFADNYDKTKNPEILDKTEIKKAKQAGFSLFKIHKNMNETEFVNAYMQYCQEHKDDLSELNRQERNIHVKYIQLQYQSEEKIKDDETIEEFEARLKASYDKALDNAIDANMPKSAPEFGLGEKVDKNGYVIPDPTMCRDPETHDW